MGQLIIIDLGIRCSSNAKLPRRYLFSLDSQCFIGNVDCLGELTQTTFSGLRQYIPRAHHQSGPDPELQEAVAFAIRSQDQSEAQHQLVGETEFGRIECLLECA